MRQRRLFIMVKEPHPGRVKTRLGHGIGMVRAAWWFRHQSQALIRRLSTDPRWQTVLAVAPDVEGLNSRVWPAHLPRWAQGVGDLGMRMGAIFRQAPQGPVVIIGADIPNIQPTMIEDAFRALGRHDAVLGPAPDGGYWLIGMRRGKVPAGLFASVRWSTEHALADTVDSMNGLKVGYINTLQDVDTVADLNNIGA